MADHVCLFDKKMARLAEERDLLARLRPQLPPDLPAPRSVLVHPLFGSDLGLSYEAGGVWEAVELLERFHLVGCHVHRDGLFTSVRPGGGERYGIRADMEQFSHQLEAYVQLEQSMARVAVSVPKGSLGRYRKSNPNARVHYKMVAETFLKGDEQIRFAAASREGEHSGSNVVTLWASRESMHQELEIYYGRRAPTADH